MTQIIEQLADIADRYEALYVDLWGCLHDGVNALPEAVEALRAYRARGGAVVLLTNAPRSRSEVAKQIASFGVPDDCWDNIASSGDSARVAMYQGAVGQKVWFLGRDFDLSFFDPIKVLDDPLEITRVPLEEAEGIICCGPEDPHADPEIYRPQFLYAKTKGLKLLCANPDIIVDRGGRREWCAGALAKLYTEMGGESLYFGKPHPPIYDLAKRRLAEVAADVPNSAILAIGDGLRTDILGALGEEIDSLFVSGGIAAQETKTAHQPDPQALSDYLERENLHPTFVIGALR